MPNQKIEEDPDKWEDLLPPWLKYPELQRYSLGWRMGYGEQYLQQLHVRLEAIDPEYLIQYLTKYSPIPIAWLDWTSMVLGYSLQDVDAGVRKLVELGLAKDFSEFKTWHDSVWKGRIKKL